MRFDNQLMAPVALALLTALVVSFLMTPVVKSFAYKVGAIDVPKDERRMHHKPIPRLGGLAIFAGFMASILLFVDIRLNPQMQSILLGAVIIVVLGVVDDIMALPAKLKFVIQIAAALIPALNGVSIQALSNPNIFSPNAYWVLNWLSIPITVLWIVGITNAVNLIDGLDGLANGVSAISAATVLVIALICSEAQVAVVMAALVGACVGFLPYNLNPAKMFMGDTGATFLGFILSTPAMFMFVPGVCVPVRSPERSNCTDKQVKHSDFGLSAFSIGVLRGSFHLHHSPASVCCFIPSDPIEMSSAGFPVKLVFGESYFLLRFLRNLRDLGISWKCGMK